MKEKNNTPKLDPSTLDVVKRVLATPPKKNEDLKVGRKKKRRGAKDRAASSKRRSV
jgi:hypothetical protein